MKKIIFFLAVLCLLITGCEEKQINEKTGLPDPYYCENDDDCAVKDVHNCCGYYPRCVNADHEPDIEAVKEECKEKRSFGVCGFPEITGCRCIENRCESMQGSDIV